MTFFEVTFYITALVLTLVLAFFVFFRKKTKEARNLALLLICASSWIGVVFSFFYFQNQDIVLWTGRASFAVVLLVILSFISFVRSFPLNFEHKKQSYFYLSIKIITIIFAVITLFTPFVIENEIITGMAERDTEYGFLYSVWIAYFIFLFSLVIINLIDQYKKTKEGIKKKQVLYILIGSFISILFGFVNIILLKTLGFSAGERFGGPLALLIFFAFASYTILRHRLMDIRVATGRAFIYFFTLTSFFFFAYLFYIFEELLDVSETVKIILALFLGGLLFNPLFSFFEKIASKYLYYSFYSSQKTLSEMGRKLTEILDLQQLTKLITSTLKETMQSSRVVILLRDKETGKFHIERNIGFREENGISLVQDNFLTDWLQENNKILVYEELSLILQETKEKELREKVEKLQENMKRIEADLCIPLLLKKELIGVIVLGEKISGDPYSKQDIELLDSLFNQFSTSLENARLYSEVQDLSENLEKKVQEQVSELQKAYKKLQRIDQMKTEFISIVSHQLRTPLSVIKGHLSMVNEGVYNEEPEKKAKVLNDVYEANERLIGLVNDVLNASRIQSGRVEIKKEKADIVKVISDVVEKLMPSAKERGLKMVFHKPKKDFPEVNIDPSKVENILINFIDNAIKYTNTGSVEVYLYEEEEEVMIKIKDTGEGMDQKELEKLFETFSRGGAGKKYWIQGAGLGLYIARQFTELHNGKVWAESEGKGKGSSFYIKLPKK
jgi:signal transduction histidine kinase